MKNEATKLLALPIEELVNIILQQRAEIKELKAELAKLKKSCSSRR
jgi:uncharacterized small protein (DUF1192 family)